MIETYGNYAVAGFAVAIGGSSLVAIYGKSYSDYQQQVPMLIPFSKKQTGVTHGH